MTQSTVNPRSHLFISYASEDSELAGWLARKLAAEGYPVWFDRMKLLGGEPWVQDIDVAIKERTFRFLALLSANSSGKPNPTKERTCALGVGKKLNIPDFIIPIRVDSSEVDWLMSDLNWVHFNHGWADGWRQLLVKLDKANAPRPLVNGKALAASTFDVSRDLVKSTSETVFTNILPVDSTPSVLQHMLLDPTKLSAVREKLPNAWAHHTITAGEVFSYGPPPKEFAHVVGRTKPPVDIAKPKGFEEEAVRNAALNLLEKTIRVRLLRAGVKSHPKHFRTFYLGADFIQDGWLRFTGWSGKQRKRKIVGRMTVLRPNKPPEEVHHHFAFEIRRWNLSHEKHAFQVRASLVFSDKMGVLITDKRVGPLRRKLTRMWYNDEWLERLLAAIHIILTAAPVPDDGLVLGKALLQVDCAQSIDESTLGGSAAPTEDTDNSLPEGTVQLDDNDSEEGDESESA